MKLTTEEIGKWQEAREIYIGDMRSTTNVLPTSVWVVNIAPGNFFNILRTNLIANASISSVRDNNNLCSYRS